MVARAYLDLLASADESRCEQACAYGQSCSCDLSAKKVIGSDAPQASVESAARQTAPGADQGNDGKRGKKGGES